MDNAKWNRSKLAEAIAIDRAEYERTYAGREKGWQPLRAFVHDVALGMARRGTPIQGIQVSRGDYGVSLYARIDWDALAARVERQLPVWKATLERMEASA
jgi:hypothetical protein